MPGAVTTTANNMMKTWNKESSSIRIAVIESNLRVSGHACTVFHIMLEDNKNHFSLVRFIQDFEELDVLLLKHFPKHRIPLPKLIDNSSSISQNNKYHQKKTTPTKLFFSTIKNKNKKSKKTNTKRNSSSNAEVLEKYLYNCIKGQIGSSSLFRDFLSVQRDEDRMISKVIVNQLVAQHHAVAVVVTPKPSFVTHQPPSPPFPPEINNVITPTTDSLLSMTPPYTLKRKRSINTIIKCQQQQQQQQQQLLPPSPPSSISITISPIAANNESFISMTQFPEYHRHDSGLTSSSSSSLYNNDDMMMCSSILGQKEELYLQQQQQQLEQQKQKAMMDKNNNNDTINDFQLIKCLGKGASSKVILVRDQTSHQLFALKAITKSWNITKREVNHIRMERDILTTLSSIHHPFLVRLYKAFQDVQSLYLVLDYHAGADLATLLQRYICFPAEQCRLYAAEIVMGLQELHRHCILYRDLKPENVLLASDGHIVLTDFGLSKMFNSQDEDEHRTMTFCGTPEYLAPEIILQEEEYSYAADFWSLGTMLFEMLVGVTPFAAPTSEEMYDRVLYDDLLFPAQFDPEAMDLIAGLLDRDPLHRLGAGLGGVFELRTHAYFSAHLNWKDVHAKRIKPIYVPPRCSEIDLSNFDPDFLNMSTHIKEETDEAVMLRQRWLPDACPAGLLANAFRGYSYMDDQPPSSYQSELSFFGSDDDEYMLYDDQDDDSLTEQQQEQNIHTPPHFLHSTCSSTSSISVEGTATAHFIQKNPPLRKFTSHRSMLPGGQQHHFNYHHQTTTIRNSLVN